MGLKHLTRSLPSILKYAVDINDVANTFSVQKDWENKRRKQKRRESKIIQPEKGLSGRLIGPLPLHVRQNFAYNYWFLFWDWRLTKVIKKRKYRVVQKKNESVFWGKLFVAIISNLLKLVNDKWVGMAPIFRDPDSGFIKSETL